jgi:CheY-like chemotaxis protein
MAKKILIVDDNDINRELLERVLKRAGYSTCCAVDGPSGISAAKEERPDLILMDITLGGNMDGWEATQLIKSTPDTAEIPIIACTARSFMRDREKSMDVGCAEHETKPIDFRRLLNKIEVCLGTKHWTRLAGSLDSCGSSGALSRKMRASRL